MYLFARYRRVLHCKDQINFSCSIVAHSTTQIRFESFTEPLLLLGCFDLVTKSFEATPPGSLDPSQLSSTGSFTSFEAEFKSWRPPNDNLDEDTFVFSASEVFRFLRDMALDIPASQSTSLLEVHVRPCDSGVYDCVCAC